ncbi:hypothetical protein [uncultured Bacteroides sp.]|uniref:hypothetical protein n=1 Tax=uncultured Bacteroides sp. TaxID=162156 RepID=UPI002621283F|nr:hypothetical protein [uncultured Bacteroides sp.]
MARSAMKSPAGLRPSAGLRTCVTASIVGLTSSPFFFSVLAISTQALYSSRQGFTGYI